MTLRAPLCIFLVLSFISAVMPFAAAQSLDEICNTNYFCISLLVLVFVILLISTLSKRAREQRARHPNEPSSPSVPATPRYGSPTGYPPSSGYGQPSSYSQTPQYPGVPQPQTVPGYAGAPSPQYAPGYQGAPSVDTAPSAPHAGGDFMLTPASRPAPKPRRVNANAVCPRCGSSAVQDFDTGEHKCLVCKKIFMD